MYQILNQQISGPHGQVLQSFKNGICIKTLIHKGEDLYRIVTKEDTLNNIAGNNFIKGEFWIDKNSFNEISSRVNYDNYRGDITNIARNKLAITTSFSNLADGFIGVYLKEDVYAWKGKAASQFEFMKNGMRIIYPGNLTQLWIPNLNPQIVRYKFFHSI